MIGYIDSSVLLRILLNTDTAYTDFNSFDTFGSSELLVIECHRVLDRYRMESLLSDSQIAEAKNFLQAMIDGMALIEMSEAVKKRAQEPFPTVIGTLDALHLSTALLWKEYERVDTLTVISHDRQMNMCAKALGFITINS